MRFSDSVSQSTAATGIIELHRRQPNGNRITYFYNESERDDAIEFQSVGLETNIDEIYRRVNFQAGSDDSED